MGRLEIPPGVVPGFHLEVEARGSRVTVTCSGTLDVRDPSGTLQPELLRLHRELLEAKVSEVRLDFVRVEYMNSSGIKCFMAWFLKAEKQEPRPYTFEVVYDPNRTWQYVSFTTMGHIAPNVLRMAPIAKADPQ
ncbi:MAG: hypothetical protein HYZ28_21695 [Myxococcales bacterium]|nr:hypothetical protein [Myxococcales bacterium]